MQTKVFSTTKLAYPGDVSATELLTGKTATSVGGIHGVSGMPVEGTWTTVGATAIYSLGLGANNLGHNLTSIQSIEAWVNVGSGNRAYTVEVKLVGATSHISPAPPMSF